MSQLPASDGRENFFFHAWSECGLTPSHRETFITG